MSRGQQLNSETYGELRSLTKLGDKLVRQRLVHFAAEHLPQHAGVRAFTSDADDVWRAETAATLAFRAGCLAWTGSEFTWAHGLDDETGPAAVRAIVRARA